MEEVLQLQDGRTLTYKQVDSGFSNPNNVVNARVLDWMCTLVRKYCLLESDLLEMYCGNGNHTVALAGMCVCMHVWVYRNMNIYV